MLRNQAYNPVLSFTFTIVSQLHFFSYLIQFNTIPSFCLLLSLVCGHKIIISHLPKCKYCAHRSKKQSDLNPAAAAIPGPLSVVLAGPRSLFASLLDFDPMAATGFLGVAGLVITSILNENLVKNCVEFCDFG